MALLGQGDPRWLVEKREDGTNVNAWHWSEKDALPWSRVRLAELLGNLTLLDGAGGGPAARTTGIKSVEGDAVLNVRPNKYFPALLD
jgi:activator of HSP90 ATPase